MDGLLVIDKPAGPSSHGAVVRMRRALGEPRIGHTGTLDPAATGVLPLVIGRATRLARFLSSSDKSYEAVVRLGTCTTTGDAEGDRLGPEHCGPLPSRNAIDAALDEFRGTFLQQPPAFSAKRIGGKRSYQLARRAGGSASPTASATASFIGSPIASPPGPALPRPVSVTARAIDLLEVEGERVTLRLDCSAGFYVRSLAHDLGERLGTGAHLLMLRRSCSGEFTLAEAIGLDRAERDPLEAARRVVPLSGLLTRLASVVLTSGGVQRAVHGRDLGPADWVSPPPPFSSPRVGPVRSEVQGAVSAMIRLLDPGGDLVGLAEPAQTPGLLHPSIVLM
jgi:tRNA pseudouridine55 synthase